MRSKCLGLGLGTAMSTVLICSVGIVVGFLSVWAMGILSRDFERLRWCILVSNSPLSRSCVNESELLIGFLRGSWAAREYISAKGCSKLELSSLSDADAERLLERRERNNRLARAEMLFTD